MLWPLLDSRDYSDCVNKLENYIIIWKYCKQENICPHFIFTPFALVVRLSEFQYLILSLMKHNWLSGRILVLVKSCTKWRRAKSHGVKKLYTLYTALQLAYKPFPLNFNRHKHKCLQMPLVIDNSNTCIFMQVQQIRCWTLVEFWILSEMRREYKWGPELLSWFSITSIVYILV